MKICKDAIVTYFMQSFTKLFNKQTPDILLIMYLLIFYIVKNAIFIR